MKYEKEMQIYLFGNSGFLGSHLYNKLTKNNTTVILYPANLDQLEKIVPKKTGKLKRNIFVSMAWISNNSKNYQKDNSNFKLVEQHINLAEFCKRNNYELLIPGTCLEYQTKNRSAYVESKRNLYQYLKKNFPTNKLFWVRYFYIFSLSSKRPRLIAEALESVNRETNLTLNNPYSKHDYIEVDDAIDQTIEILDKRLFGVWDVGTGLLKSNKDLLERIPGIIIDPSHHKNTMNLSNETWNHGATILIPGHTRFIKKTNEFFGSL